MSWGICVREMCTEGKLYLTEKKRVFISFDFDHDEELRDALVAQAKNPDSPFNILDSSLKEPINENWKKKVRNLFRSADLTVVICGEHTHTASGVAAEVTIAREERKPYFLLKGRRNMHCTRPRSALRKDKINKWTWNNLRRLIAGEI